MSVVADSSHSPNDLSCLCVPSRGSSERRKLMGGVLCIMASMISVYILSRSSDGSLKNGDRCWVWMPSRNVGILAE